MNYVEFLSSMLNLAWSFFGLSLPFIGLTVAQVLIGSMVVLVGMSIVKNFLDFGFSSVRVYKDSTLRMVHNDKKYEARYQRRYGEDK